MARPREFNEIAALAAAVDCFWKRGYEATSMRDLAASMGLSAPSLYNAFGNKQSTFCPRPGTVSGLHDARPAEPVGAFVASKKAIHRFFAEIIDHSINDRERKGCFLVNSALEVAAHQTRA